MFVENMVLDIPKVAEIDLNLARDGDAVANAVAAVERDLRVGDDDVRAGAQFGQGSFLLGVAAHDLETTYHRAACLDRSGDGAVDRVRDVNAGGVAAVGADV